MKTVGRPHRLTPAAVRFLRRWHAGKREHGRKTGLPEKRLCVRYDVSRSAIYQAATGRTYRWVAP